MKSLPDTANILLSAEARSAPGSTIEAWEQFIATGEFPTRRPRAVIATSWQRCRSIGLNPHAERARVVISHDEIEARLHKENFGLSGRAVLDRMAHTVEGTGHVIVLADKAGRILYSVGHRRIQDRLESINFRPGGAWGEEVAGPNGIGTSLALGKPEVIMGAEHYCAGWQPWACYGAPVYNPGDHSIMGCVDITGPAGKAQDEVMALAVSIAHSVEFCLSATLLRRREALREVFLSLSGRFPDEALLLLDETGNITAANNMARELLALTSPALLRGFKQLYPELSLKAGQCLLSGLEAECRVNLYHCITGAVRCVLQPVTDKGERIGCALLFPSGRVVNRPPAEHHARPAPAAGEYGFDRLIGASAAFKKCVNMARMAAADKRHNSVLLTGETGAGKTFIARAIHAGGLARQGPFVAVNCAGLCAGRLAGQLRAQIEAADNAAGAARPAAIPGPVKGTLFLDEVDALGPALQAELARFLDNEAEAGVAAGSGLRIIATATTELSRAVEQGRFRRDLLHRLNVIGIQTPALRQRDADSLILLRHFIKQEANKAGKDRLELGGDVTQRLICYDWPGNLRELRNLSARWVLMIKGRRVGLPDLPERIRFYEKTATEADASTIRSVEDALIRKTLAEMDGNVSKTARVLGINRSTIYRHNLRCRKNS